MKECPIEGFAFTSTTPKVVALKRGMTLQRIKEVTLRKLYREAQERFVIIHFCYTTRLCGGVSHYTAIEMTEDDDVEAFFGIYDSIELKTMLEYMALNKRGGELFKKDFSKLLTLE